MCGRYSLFVPAEDLAGAFDVRVEGYEPRYNAAPGQDLPVITDTESDRLSRLEWGLIPSWADSRTDGGHINARAESVAEKPSFRESFHQSEGDLAAGRCLVPADGFYEWVQQEGDKQPYRVTLVDDRPFAMAGLWAQWRPPTTQTGLDAFGSDGEPETEVVETFTIVTTEPNDLVADLHHRMAVILSPDEQQRWLTGDAEAAAELLDPSPAEEMCAYPVSTAVNDPANDSPSVVEPIE
jgi:putative SOS response-associated peptidase YedK